MNQPCPATSRARRRSALILVAALLLAAASLEAAQPSSKDENARLLNRVQDLMAAGRADSVIAMLGRRIAAGPGDGRLERALAMAAGTGGFETAALRIIEESLRRRPGDPHLHMALGELELGRQRPDVALRHFQRALVIDAFVPGAAGGFARARARQGTDIGPALSYFDKLALQRPGLPAPRYGRAVLLLETARADESLKDFRWAIGLDESNWLYERDYARALDRMGNRQGAIEHLEKARRLAAEAGDPLIAAEIAAELRAAGGGTGKR